MLNKEFPKPHQNGAPDRTRDVFLFGPFRLDAGERVLLRDGEPVALTPRAFDTLLVLVARAGRLVEKDQLLEEVWQDTYVEEKTLAQNVLTIRKALGSAPGGAPYVETVPKHGYRFAAGVRVVAREGADFPRADFPAATRTRTEVILEEEFESSDDAGDETVDERAGETPRAAHASDADALASPADAPRAVAAETPAAAPKRRAVMITAAVAAAACALVAAVVFVRHVAPDSATPFERFEIKKLTATGDVSSIAISPDGRYAAYAPYDAGRSRLLVRQMDGTGSVEVVPAAEVKYVGITFAKDGASVFYVTRAKDSVLGVLYRVPVLGGAPVKLIEDVDSPVALSPDGARAAFVRVSRDQRETALVVADLSGGGSRVLASRGMAEGFSVAGPAWSPDGRRLACASNVDPTAKWSARLLVVDAADGSVAPFSANRWSWIGRAAWGSDGRGLILVAWDNESAVMSDQIWYVPYPAGEPRRITNDVNGYLGVSVSADARAMLTARSERVAGFWVAPLGDANSATKAGGVSADLYSERHGMAWTPDERIVYASTASGEPNVWVMNADGSARKQLTSERGGNVQPAVSPDGRTIVFVSYRTGERHLWAMNADGGEPRQLTRGEGDDAPTFTPDGAWIVYTSYAGGRPTLWKMPARGGAAVRVADIVADDAAVSPDGKLVACHRYADPLSHGKLALVSLADGVVVREFELPGAASSPALRWTPDGKAVALVAMSAGVSNLWLQPVDGATARRLTDFKTERIFRFDISRDGRLVFERGANVNDAILIRAR
ncbi:MAG TPA: winged helix-turn-helix domain-containing protein [Pyrinomonadaceae bacterium]|jgi:Tol biopolymer transport system component/DNA-binding winged helix-turn-helix (wHTH) protein|nr:winged helix-turn-helix domain-containing protein [Pyrinomonadaceae bacterium]